MASSSSTTSEGNLFQEVEKEIEKGLSDLFGTTGIGIGIGNNNKNNKKHIDIHLEKSQILLKTRHFHDSIYVRENPTEIIQTIVQLLFLQNSNYQQRSNYITHNGNVPNQNINCNERLTSTEATELFFAITKLFVTSTMNTSSNSSGGGSNNFTLRRLTYIVLKDLIPLCAQSDVIMITSCLTKDMTGGGGVGGSSTSTSGRKSSTAIICKSHALRVLKEIIDSSMLSAIERYMKQAILEYKSSSLNNRIRGEGSTGSSGSGSSSLSQLHGMVSSAALVSSLHLLLKSNENAAIVKRWVNEVYEVFKSNGSNGEDTISPGSNRMIEFHALILYYQMKKSDRLAISKFVQIFCKGVINNKNIGSRSPVGVNTRTYSNVGLTLTSPLAITCLIRYTYKLLHEEIMEGRITSFTYQISSSSSNQLCATGYQFLKSCLKHESEMVAFEAASSICSLATATTSSAPHNESDHAATLEDIQPALSVLQLLLSSHKPAARLGTIKLLYKLAVKYPSFVCGRFNDSLEALIGDSNRLIGTLSIMTLIRTYSGRSNVNDGSNISGGDNTAIDRLLKHISSFIGHIADEYKIMVIKSLEQLCVSYPMKFSIIISFLSKFLRDDGGFLFKRTIVYSIESLMESLPETRDIALLYLCEFIEDCEYVTLSTCIITILGNLGPSTTSPARYVRFIYNRCILDNAMIRAASVLALSKFGAGCPSLRSSILALLRSCLTDENDETRDRVILAITILEDAEGKCPYDPLKEEDGVYDEHNTEKHKKGDDLAVFLLINKLPCSFDMLERRLKLYKETENFSSNEPLSLSNLPVVEDIVPVKSEAKSKQDGLIDTIIGATSLKNSNTTNSLDAISRIPEFAAFGRVLLSTKPVPLTETEAEYVVHCVKHIFENHVVLQFITQNTIEDQRLENVYVSLENDSKVFELTGEIPVQNILYGASASSYCVLDRKSDMSLESCTFGCELKFTVVQINPTTGEDEGESYEEEFSLENLTIFTTDFFSRTTVADFRRAWDNVGNSNEVLQKFALQEKDLCSAVDAVVDCIGLQTCDGTHLIKPGAKQHMLHLSGTYLGRVTIVARSQVSLAPSGSIILKIAIRSEDADVSKLVATCLG